MNLIDGNLVDRDGKTFFKAGESFDLELPEDAAVEAKKTAKTVSQELSIRLGIRSEYIKLSKEKQSDKAFQLPVYAVTHEAESTLVYFELKNTFLHSRIRAARKVNSLVLEIRYGLSFP
ncbi:MAG: hypothetical protein U5N58_04105 [Actinomycetota bacterium]|nr:hypothetical protein [Actinomycetota bacterium]